uniref:aminodeoxychorismate synthase n=1 Tax=Eiseniibacteriota bacterium TaxID=2212470 RepID=A0A832MLZ1_UNCEI
MAFAAPLPRLRAVPVRDLGAAMRALADLPHPFLLHSMLEDERARWSFFGADPFAVFRGGDHAAAIAAFRAHAARAAGDAPPGIIPFAGGAVGYWAYDYGRRLERLPARARDDLGLPDFWFACYDVVVAYDHATREAWAISSGLPVEGAARAAHAERRLDEIAWRLEALAPAVARWDDAPGAGGVARSTFGADAYRRAVEAVREHIRRGDIFQANLSQRWTLPLAAARPCDRALSLFEAIARHTPAPYAAFLCAGDHAVASASPERFLAVRGRRVETRPIKGTRPRGADAAEDRRLAAELLASAKDRAENVMIVDVLRNDLGRVCETGSVRTPELCALESFPQVHHLVSTVEGTLREGLDPFDLLHACFPGGSITGAPKIRAMEILDALEPVRRHVYTGAVGYVDWRGHADWNIAIRTALVTRDAVHVAAGGGVTADSDPDAEYEETLHKAEGLRAALSAAVGPVTLDAAPAGVR